MFCKTHIIACYLAFILLLPFQVPCNGKINHRCENSSSCGPLFNIDYPFRLSGDPSNCGDPNYELTCDNNKPILNLYSGKYYVHAIHYDNSTLQVADVGLQDGNCASLPLYSLNYHNFSTRDLYWPAYISSDQDVMFLKCKNPIESTNYIAHTYPCLSSNQISSSVKVYQYAVVGTISALELGNNCTIDLMARTNMQLTYPFKKLSYPDVHEALVFGFDIRWYQIQCKECEGQGYCIFDRTTYFVNCTDPCNFRHISSFQCLMSIVITFAYYIMYLATYIIAFLIGARTVFGVPCVVIFLIYKWRRRHLSMFDSVEEFLQNHNNLMPIRYSYSQIRKMTNNFKNKLGEGGYGSVYKGKLRSGDFVAVKMLGKSKANGQDFINEVGTIGRIHHVNIVRLIGYCFDRSKCGLVYEFMTNGSLDKYVSSRKNYVPLTWEKMYEISLGIARGIEYLHRGCEMQILHFDIKPHNILLDKNFSPKISDFGLAKLYPTNNTVVSLTAVRGTIGYIAPELFYKNIGGVSYKADVYSFGMLLLEMAGEKKNNNNVTEEEEEENSSYFPFCVYDRIVDDEKEAEIVEDGIEEEDEKKMRKKMVMVGLWCIQVNPVNRPSMNEVVKMLEGELENLQLPPRLFLYPEESQVKVLSAESNNGDGDTNPTCSSFAESISFVGNSI